MKKVEKELKEIYELDKATPKTFIELHPYIKEEVDFQYIAGYLYHGIRFQQDLEIFESILRDGKIKAGKYLENYYFYSENCNEGEYVSLLEYSEESEEEFGWFIKGNVSFFITPFLTAYRTISVSYPLWTCIDKYKLSLQNRFSYAKGEYHVKDFVDLNVVRAVGIPYSYTKICKSLEDANKLLRDVMFLMHCYGYDFPIVDTSRNNRILYSSGSKLETLKTYVKTLFEK